MMVYHVFVIKDVAVGAFMRPFFVRARGEGVRVFTDEVNRADAQNPLYGHPGDFELWFLCLWQDDTGEFSLHPNGGSPERIASGVDVRLSE